MKLTNYIALLTLGLLFSFNASAGMEGDAVNACKAAESARQEAAKVKMEWTTTGKLIKAGKAAIEKGEFDKALKSCKKAKFQGEASVKQAASEMAAWKMRVPK